MRGFMDQNIAIHETPVWQNEADFLIFADLSNAGMPGCWEQLWVKQIGPDEFVICCIPFFTYGIALGDHVRTAGVHGRRYVISSVVQRSGHRIVRMWIKHLSPALRIRIGAFLSRYGLLFEAGSADLLAVDIPKCDTTFEAVSVFLDELKQDGKVEIEMV